MNTRISCLVVAAVAFTSSAWAQAPGFLLAWGEYGSGDGQFTGIWSIAVSPSGVVYVGDEDNRIQKFDSNGSFLGKWGSFGSGDGQFDVPQGVALHPNGDVYVADLGNNRIQKFDSNGAFLGKWGSFGSGDGQFDGPFAIAVDGAGLVYVVDSYSFDTYGLPRIQKFDGNGGFLGSWLSPGSGAGVGWVAAGIAVDPSGDVYMAEYSSNQSRIVKFDSSGAVLGSWGSYGTGDGQFLQIAGITVDGIGNVYATDNTLALIIHEVDDEKASAC